MATPKEQIAQHTYAEAPQHQQVADDPLAPAPTRFTPRRGGGASDAEPLAPPRGREQASTPPRQTRDHRQQARVTQAYPPDYEDADDHYTAQARTPRSAMRYQQTLPQQYRGQVVLPTPPQQLRPQRLTGAARPPRKQRRSGLSALYRVTRIRTLTAPHPRC